MNRILVTGGAGFIGSFLVDRLVADGYSVTVVDTLEQQVHGGREPAYLNRGCRYVWGDCGDHALIAPILAETDVVFHLASLVGVGQSMYEVERYTKMNCQATAALWEEIIKVKDRIRKVVVASSISIYGEGCYRDEAGKMVFPVLRPETQLRARDWEVKDRHTGKPLTPVATIEDKPLDSGSVYAISKKYQEELSLILGRTYQIPTVACRFFNAYGSRQALSNPYTGVAAIFCARLLQGKPPLIFEDGAQLRDFVHVSDLVAGLVLCMQSDAADYESINLGSGHVVSVVQIAGMLSEEITGGRVKAEITGQFRSGDIRHCFADIDKARRLLGYAPVYRLETGIPELVAWVKQQQDVKETLTAALAEARARGIVS